MKVNCKSRCHFSWLPQTLPSSATRPIICWPVIYLVTSFPSFLASFIHTPSFPSPPLHHSAYPISSPRSHFPISPPPLSLARAVMVWFTMLGLRNEAAALEKAMLMLTLGSDSAPRHTAVTNECARLSQPSPINSTYRSAALTEKLASRDALRADQGYEGR